MTLAACSSHPAIDDSVGDGGAREVVSLPDPGDGGVAWDGWAGEFVSDYCVACHNPTAPCGGSGCHPSAGQIPDFRTRSAVFAYAPMIRCGISVKEDPSWQCGATPPEQFPVVEATNPLPTDEQRAILVGWIDAGCP
jgi:hypothetical protein